jgi:hypothetical protein
VNAIGRARNPKRVLGHLMARAERLLAKAKQHVTTNTNKDHTP